jgi:non-homologous end joining protein Ku
LKKTQTEAKIEEPEEPEEETGDDLAAALKAALNRRKGAVGDSGTLSFIKP